MYVTSRPELAMFFFSSEISFHESVSLLYSIKQAWKWTDLLTVCHLC